MLSAWQINVLLFRTFWIIFNIFDPQLVEYVDVEPTDAEGQLPTVSLYSIFTDEY